MKSTQFAENVVHYKDCSRYNWHDPDAQCDGARCHPDPEQPADHSDGTMSASNDATTATEGNS